MSMSEKTALVLAGGGARGSYQIGVWQALRELDISVDIVTGTSVGALNAALIAMRDFENALELWKKIDTSMILAVELDAELPVKEKTMKMVQQFFRDYSTNGGMDSYPLKQLLGECCNEEAIRESDISFGLVAFEKKGMKSAEFFIEDIKEGQLIDYLVASASLYPAMKVCEIDGNEYIDGGYCDNLPVSLALKKGADRIIAVDLEAIGIIKRSVIESIEDLVMIRSYWDLGPLLVFDRDTIAKNLRLGYLDAMKAYGVYDGIAYAFIKSSFPEFIRRYKTEIVAQNEVLSLSYSREGIKTKEELFHLHIQNVLQKRYNRKVQFSYTVFLMACAEVAGELFGLDCEKLYSISSFSDKLNDKLLELMPSIEPLIIESASKLKLTLALLDKKNRAIHLGILIKRATQEESKLDILALSLFAAEELMAAYFLALIA